jgi:signal transduction histidine kinase
MREPARRSNLVVIVLGLTVLLSVVLAAQALSAARGQRASAERVLRDYAALGADGAALRLKGQLGSRFNPVLLAAAAPHSAAPATTEELRKALSGGALEVLDSASRVMRIDPRSGAVRANGPPLSAAAAESLVSLEREATKPLPGYAYFGLAWTAPASGELLVFQPLRDNGAPATAFTLSRSALSALLNEMIAKDPVLPASLVHGPPLTSGAGLRVTSASGPLADRGFDTASLFRAAVPLGSPFGDLAVEVSLSDSLAPALIIGGLPRSRMPLLVALLGMTILLALAAIAQLRRETELSRLREDFVASASHELRTPLAQIRLFAETLRLGRVRTDEEGERSIGIIENEAKRLEHLVQNLLHFSRSERGDLSIDSQPTDLTALLGQIASEFAPLAARSESSLVLALEPGVHADVDRAAVRQIVLNLLDNAVKYGGRPQVITVRLAADWSEVRIEIEDQGEGISEALRTRVWERFWRGDAARRNGVSGTGIGLAIVRDLTGAHGGSAQVDDAPGGGARIVLRLPARRS